MRIAVLHRPYRNSEWQTKFTGVQFTDDAIEEARHHAAAIAANGHETVLLTWQKDLKANIDQLLAGRFDLVANASSLQEVALLELLRIPFMGSGLDLVALDKATRKRLWIESGVVTPGFAHVTGIGQLGQVKLPEFPLFVKPDRGRGSSGITDESIVHDHAALEKACRRIIETMGQAALVEEYIQGTEVTVGVIGNGSDLTVLPPLEIEYTGDAKTNTYEHKQDHEIFHCPARLEQEVIASIKDAARRAFMALGARDFGRIDFIYDHKRRQPYALELNTFAGLQILSGAEQHLHASYIGQMAVSAGWDSVALFGRLVDTTRTRYGVEPKQSVAGAR